MNTICEYKTKLHACSIEYLETDVFAVGSYELNEETRERAGEIAVMTCKDGVVSVLSALHLDSGVLDMKVSNGILGAAMSVGTLDLYEMEGWSLRKLCGVSKPDEGLFLSLDFDNRLSTSSGILENDSVAVSTQSGSLLVYKYSEGGLSEELHLPAIHCLFGESMPVWITAFNTHTRQSLLTGGDDCKFRLWDLRSTETGSSSSGLIHTSSLHTAGVTSAQWHPSKEHVFVTGSYDESAYLWDDRQLRQPLLHLETGGGVWRAKWLASELADREYLITASMQGGSRVYQLASTSSEDESRCSFNVAGCVEHTDGLSTHLAYGIDAIRRTAADETEVLTLASCSFYDNVVQVWSGRFGSN